MSNYDGLLLHRYLLTTSFLVSYSPARLDLVALLCDRLLSGSLHRTL
jgi:hypothetical protein